MKGLKGKVRSLVIYGKGKGIKRVGVRNGGEDRQKEMV